VARAKRRKPHNPAKIHDRRSRDLLRNAEVAAIEVDDPLGLDPGDKIVTLRSIRNDPLARLHTHRQIDEAQYQGGRAFQDDWEKAERGSQAVDPSREYVDGGQQREPITERADLWICDRAAVVERIEKFPKNDASSCLCRRLCYACRKGTETNTTG
jgi:hypothetical protein